MAPHQPGAGRSVRGDVIEEQNVKGLAPAMNASEIAPSAQSVEGFMIYGGGSSEISDLALRTQSKIQNEKPCGRAVPPSDSTASFRIEGFFNPSSAARPTLRRLHPQKCH